MYKGSRERFAELFQRADREEPTLEGLLLWHVIELAAPQAKLLAIGGRLVAYTQGDELGTALLWPRQDSESGELTITARLYHPAMGEGSLVCDCSTVSKLKELWKLLPNS